MTDWFVYYCLTHLWNCLNSLTVLGKGYFVLYHPTGTCSPTSFSVTVGLYVWIKSQQCTHQCSLSHFVKCCKGPLPCGIVKEDVVSRTSNHHEEAENCAKNREKTRTETSTNLWEGYRSTKPQKSCCLQKRQGLFSQLEQPVMWWSKNLCLCRAIKNPRVCLQQCLDMSCRDVNTAGGISKCSCAWHQQMRWTKREIFSNYLECLLPIGFNVKLIT